MIDICFSYGDWWWWYQVSYISERKVFGQCVVQLFTKKIAKTRLFQLHSYGTCTWFVDPEASKPPSPIQDSGLGGYSLPSPCWYGSVSSVRLAEL